MDERVSLFEIVGLFFGLPASDELRMLGKIVSRYLKTIRSFLYELF